MAGDADNENGIASDGEGDGDASRDLDGANGEGDRDVVIKKDGVGTKEGTRDSDGVSVGNADVDTGADPPLVSDSVMLITVGSGVLVVGAAAVVVVDCPLL